ncbi:MAG: hypothetical protein KBE27_02375, partial [Syntrophorhabdaceae bacterium]|nr:hypothetical protein [Syntrophorhabdaceae bacterium]
MSQNLKDLNRDIFFREITVRICSSLDIGKALHRCFLFLNDIVHIEELVLVTYDEQLGTINIEAVASPEEGCSRDIKVPLPSNLQSEIEKAAGFSRIRYVKDITKDPILSLIADILGWVDVQAIIVRFILEKKYMGAFIMITKDESASQDAYLELLGFVNEPIAIALNNCRQYKNLMAFKDALSEERHYLQNELRGRY